MANIIPRIENTELKWVADYENEVSYYASNFLIYTNYDIVEEENDFGGKDLYIQATSEGHKIFNPSDFKGHLYFEIAKIQLDKESVTFYEEDKQGNQYKQNIDVYGFKTEKAKRSLIKFCSRFGLLGTTNRRYIHEKISENEFLKGQQNLHIIDNRRDRLDDKLVTQIRRMKLAVKYLVKLNNGTLADNDYIDLVNITNNEQSFTHDRIQIRDIKGSDRKNRRECFPSLLFSSLVDVAWGQVYDVLTDKQNYKKCKNERCGNYFAITHGNRDFCPPDPCAKISRCQNAANRRRKYHRKKNEKDKY
jgi:hypothetical protein